MVIQYKIKRADLIKAYFFNLRHSKKTQLTITGMAALLFLYVLLLRYQSHPSTFSVNDVMVALVFGLAVILAIPVLNFVTARTQMRTLSIQPEDIKTKIGSREGKIAWKSVDQIFASEDHIFITTNNANTYTIPTSAFENGDDRRRFIRLANGYLSKAKAESEKSTKKK